MNHIAVEHLAQERYHDLALLADAEHLARQARRAAGVGRWRRALGESLVWLGVGVGLPAGRRESALRHARSLLLDDGVRVTQAGDQGVSCTACM